MTDKVLDSQKVPYTYICGLTEVWLQQSIFLLLAIHQTARRNVETVTLSDRPAVKYHPALQLNRLFFKPLFV